ncbi:TPA: caspase family protein [Aeromonas dhakensis]|nr:caspase family protein [Aeromonas dhakensis]
MNLGIVLAISDYGSQQNDLPGCKIDGSAISSIFKSDDKFDDALIISENTTSGNVKGQLIDFINKYKDKEINDVVFYYTGHGDFSGNEFYFLLSDYDSSRKKQTTLENAELDNLLKTLGAKVTVKIVDACHSGQAYIKDSDAFDKYLHDTKSRFAKCYFMFSSQLEQYSYQDQSLSFFTKSFVSAVREHSSNIIRYKDIIDYVSDSFSSNAQQTPFFVVQADFTEPFCSISQSLRDSLEQLTVRNTASSTKDEAQFQSIVDKIKADAARYCSEEEAYQNFSLFIANFNSFNFDGDLGEIYRCKETVSEDTATSPQAIGNWLENSEHQYFAIPTYRDVEKTKRVLKENRFASSWAFAALGGAFNDDESNYKLVKYIEKEVDGYKITIEQPAKLIEIIAEPIYPNVSAGMLFIVPLLSKTELRVFYSFVHMSDSGWTERVVKQKIKWLTKAVPLKMLNHKSLSQDIMQGFEKYLLEAISKNFEMKSSDTQQADKVEISMDHTVSAKKQK